jgi:hypothetical protein
MRLQANPDLRNAFMAELQSRGFIETTDGNLAVAARVDVLITMVNTLELLPDGVRGLEMIGLLNATTPKFGAAQRARIAGVIRELMNGELRDGSGDLVDLTAVPAPVVAPAAARPAEPAKVAQVRPATGGGSLAQPDASGTADPAAGAKVDDDFEL